MWDMLVLGRHQSLVFSPISLETASQTLGGSQSLGLMSLCRDRSVVRRRSVVKNEWDGPQSAEADREYMGLFV